jgi:hypothetical protein
VPLWDGLTVGVYLDPTLLTNQKEDPMNVDVSHGPGYRLEAYATLAFRTVERSPRVHPGSYRRAPAVTTRRR